MEEGGLDRDLLFLEKRPPRIAIAEKRVEKRRGGDGTGRCADWEQEGRGRWKREGK